MCMYYKYTTEHAISVILNVRFFFSKKNVFRLTFLSWKTLLLDLKNVKYCT